MKSFFKNRLRSFSVIAGLILFACGESTSVPKPSPPDTTGGAEPVDTFGFSVVAVFPHDTGAWTQGRVYTDSFLIEGTGYYAGPSKLRKVELETGDIIEQIELQTPYYGEGVTLWGDSIIQLTWRDQVAFVYDVNTLDEIGRFNYQTEGWGLTHDGTSLIMSDGTSNIYFRDPATFGVTRQIPVTENNHPVTNLNELEYIGGRIYANVWLTDFIVIILPQTGDVVGRIDLAGLLDQASGRFALADYLNGIAYDGVNDRLFVTGKLWPRLYEIELAPRE
jgi:glutamine cyclotransferase